MEGKKKKIAFVVVRYGRDINGGAEYHCRMLAERLAGIYDVEVLTTCVKDYTVGGNHFKPGTENIEGVLVRRFAAIKYDRLTEYRIQKGMKAGRRVRRLLFRLGLSKTVSYFYPVWKWGLEADIEAQRHSVFHSDDMCRYISEHKDEYSLFIAFTADYSPFYFTAMIAGEKTLAIPTLHNAKVSFRQSLTQAFSKIRYTGFNTDTEMRLGEKMFGKALCGHGIISVGIETPEPADWEKVRKKFGLPEKYLLYIGRISREKIVKLFKYYASYSKGRNSLPLVAVGQMIHDFKIPEGVVCTGFVTDEEKRTILQHASLMINPSRYESLSLILLEALYDKVPVLVNGHCDVLKDHCRKSGGAVRFYTGCRSFCRQTRKITEDLRTRTFMAEKGKEYMESNYGWDIILPRLVKVIESF